MRKVLFALIVGTTCLFSSLVEARDWANSISAFFYNDKGKLGMTSEEFNDFESRKKKTYLVLEGRHEAVYRINDPETLAKYDFSNPNLSYQLIGSVYDHYGSSIGSYALEAGLVPLELKKTEGRKILELPVGLYVVAYPGIFGDTTKKVYDYKGSHIINTGGVSSIGYTTVALYEGKVTFFTKKKKFVASPNGILDFRHQFKFIMAYGTPEEQEKQWPMEALFTQKLKNKKGFYISPYSLGEIAIFTDKDKFGYKMIHDANSPGFGYLLTFVEPTMNAWYSGLRAGDLIMGIKDVSNLTPNIAYKYFKEDTILIVRIFRTGEVKEIVLRKKKTEPINPMLFNSGYIR